jgi:hypothetical protein
MGSILHDIPTLVYPLLSLGQCRVGGVIYTDIRRDYHTPSLSRQTHDPHDSLTLGGVALD